MLNIITLTAGLAATAAAFDCSGPYFSFYNRGGPAMSIQRLDPALFPGQQSPHLHSFDGGNGLNAITSYADTQSSTCSTARVKTDKSLYWRPTLFWNGNNTGFYRVPEKFLKIYYKFGDAGNVRANVTDFPEDLQMIAGDPFKRADGDNPARIRWSCLGENYARIDSNGFPKGFTSCKEGLTTELTFPSCWNGNPIDPKKPTAHMAWPTAGGKGIDACPAGFKTARFPEIFIEFWYDVSAFDGHYSADQVPWVLSNGDSTGYGMHADFRNGWEKGVLAKAIAPTDYCNCGCGCGNDQMKKCFGAENVNDDNDPAFKSCSAKQTFPGDDGARLDKLPGCNPIQGGPARATQVTGEGCNAAAPSASATSKTSAAGSSTTATTQPTSAPSAEAPSSKTSETGATSPTTTSLPDQDAAEPTKEAVPTTGPSSSKTAESAEPTESAEPAESTESSAYSSPTIIAPDEGNAAPTDEVVPTAEASSTGATAPTTTPAPVLGGGEDEECATPTTITITPTVYVTAGAVADTVSCDLGTIYKTVTQTATVTVKASSHLAKHKRHGHMHH